MERKLTEKETVSRLDDALMRNYIYVSYQPQINYSTNRIVGAEALVRWKDPKFGPQYPVDFIPVLETKGLMYKIDLFVFEEVCAFQKRCRDEGIYAVPVSVNISRSDIAEDLSFVNSMEKIRKAYDIPVYYLRIEITEKFAVERKELILSALDRLHDLGYVVVMDDFGTGYSSLNILKDLKVDIMKFDMSFLSENTDVRSGKIINSVVQMAKWLNTPVIAEGVETVEQADFMQSMGCYYIQGQLYKEPVGSEEFFEMIKDVKSESLSFNYKSFGENKDNSFWNPHSVESLLFNRFIGPAGIFTYQKGEVNVLRVNQKYINELAMHMDEASILRMNPWNTIDNADREKYENVLKDIIKTYKEEECETWRNLDSDCCGRDRVCIRSSIQLISVMGDQYLFFSAIRNITAEKEAVGELNDNIKKFEMAGDQSNTFSWEYNILSKEMRPCSRCKRVLGLPSVIKDYPEPVIESGLFPAEIADMYRDWHKKLAEGADHLEAILPLTADKVLFHVRYTAEFDENGRPYKAYGSAVQVVD
ncbi:MAG: EAL domain-containing protein [Lachnospiraceae bacterium]|nr:EAL domain-containing protein [Lachnospiraceae bacterium]